MANLIIKPTSGGNLVLQDEGGSAAVTVSTSGATTFAESITLSGTTNNLGTSTAGTLSSAVNFPAGHIIQTVMYHNATQVSTASTSFSNSNKVVMGTITPQFANSDILLTGHVAVSANANAAYVMIDLYKNASDFSETANLTGYGSGLIQMNDAGIWTTSGYSWLDVCTENSVTEKTYGLSVRAHSGSGSASVGWGGGGGTVMIMQEIKR